MARDDRELGANRAWAHFTRTGLILPGYQGVIAERIAERERSRDEAESAPTEDDTRLPA